MLSVLSEDLVVLFLDTPSHISFYIKIAIEHQQHHLHHDHADVAVLISFSQKEKSLTMARNTSTPL